MRVERKSVSMVTRLVVTMVMLSAFVGVALAQEGSAPAPTQAQLQAMKEKAAALGLPEGVIQLTPCVPGMGEHWANPANMPFGPIYGVVGDKVVFVEVMPSQADFEQGKSWTQILMPGSGQSIDHVDMEFVPHGHEGFTVPHYDIHAYYVSHADHMAFCPVGG